MVNTVMDKLKKAFAAFAASLLMATGFAVPDGIGYSDYQVANGDTLWRIAKRHGIGIEKLCELNGRKMYEPGWDRIKTGAHIRVPCGSVRPWMSCDEAVALYSRFLASKLSDSSCTDEEWTLFLDVDFDGVLEAVVGSVGGSACNSVTSMYCIDKRSRKVKELKYDEGREEYDMFGYTWDDTISLLKDKRTRTRGYFLKGYARNGSGGQSVVNGTGFAVFRNGVVKVTDVGAIYETYDEDKDKYDKTFWFMGENVSEQAYKGKMRMFEKRYEKIPLRIKKFSRCTDEEDLRKYMTESYKAFSCGN